MNSNKEPAATAIAAGPQMDVLGWTAKHCFFRPTRRGAQIHAAHLAHLHRAARIAFANVADPEARATLADIVEDADRVLSLCGRATQ
jgi:hypothetical protein